MLVINDDITHIQFVSLANIIYMSPEFNSSDDMQHLPHDDTENDFPPLLMTEIANEQQKISQLRNEKLLSNPTVTIAVAVVDYVELLVVDDVEVIIHE